MLQEGDEEKMMNKIPKSFHQLEDHHFPLFITYEKFSRKLTTLTLRKDHTAKVDVEDDDAHHEKEFRLRFSPKASWFHFTDYDLPEKVLGSF
jgi:hypothetical protein